MRLLPHERGHLRLLNGTSTNMDRSKGETIRARHVIERLSNCLKGVELALKEDNLPVGFEAGNAVCQTALELAVLLGRRDAYLLAERDGAGPREKK